MFKKKLYERITDNNQAGLGISFSGIIRYIPLIVCGSFFFLTIMIFAFGPLDWHVSNPAKLYIFLALCCMALTGGYILGVKKGRTSEKHLNLNVNFIFIICAVVFLIMYVPTLIATTGKWYPDVVTGITNTGKAYRLTQYYIDHGSRLVLYIRIIAAPFLVMLTPVTLLFFKKLSKANKIIGIIIIILNVCISISQGINKAVADITAQIVLVLLILLFSNHEGSKLFYRLKIIALIVVVCTLFCMYYTNSMSNRLGIDLTYSTEELNQAIENEINDNDEDDIKSDVTKQAISQSIQAYANFNTATEKEGYALLQIVPEQIRPSVLYLSSYLSHGYNGLSIALNQEFTSSYGLGFSDFSRRSILRLVGKLDAETEIYNRTYMYKTIRGGWETRSVWSTFFIYPASDISFPGTILLVFIIGFAFALSWKDAIKTKNPFALTVFFGFCMMVFYFCANNVMFQSGENFVGYTTMIVLWLVTRHILKKQKA
jgi:hypothetical protein